MGRPVVPARIASRSPRRQPMTAQVVSDALGWRPLPGVSACSADWARQASENETIRLSEGARARRWRCGRAHRPRTCHSRAEAPAAGRWSGRSPRKEARAWFVRHGLRAGARRCACRFPSVAWHWPLASPPPGIAPVDRVCPYAGLLGVVASSRAPVHTLHQKKPSGGVFGRVDEKAASCRQASVASRTAGRVVTRCDSAELVIPRVSTQFGLYCVAWWHAGCPGRHGAITTQMRWRSDVGFHG